MLRFPIIKGFSSSVSFPFGAPTPLSVEACAGSGVAVGFLSSASSVVGETIIAASIRTVARLSNIIFISGLLLKLMDAGAAALPQIVSLSQRRFVLEALY